jgi:hypothetical protein
MSSVRELRPDELPGLRPERPSLPMQRGTCGCCGHARGPSCGGLMCACRLARVENSTLALQRFVNVNFNGERVD